MRKISVRRKTPSHIEEIEIETSRRIIFSDGSKEVIIEADEPDEEINSVVEDFESLEQSIQSRKKPLLQKIREILPLPRGR